VLESVSYEDLYLRWEAGNWRTATLDFEADRRDWEEQLSETQRRAALWNYSLFFHGEDEVTDNLSPFIDAAPREEQKYALATQQADEARHSVFFARFLREVIGMDGDMAGLLHATGGGLTWGFREIIARLNEVTRRLRRRPTTANLAAAVALYHVTLEGALAQTGQHYIADYLTERDLLPGFRAGMINVTRDEQRHIALGVRLLSDLIAADPGARKAAFKLLREVVPLALVVFVPPDASYIECFGRSREDLYAEATRSFETKLRTVGFTRDEIERIVATPLEIRVEERVRRALAMIDAGVIGEKRGRPRMSDEASRYMFESVAASARRDLLPPRGLSIQWEFPDHRPWRVQLTRESASAAAGRAPSDVTVRCRMEDWVDLSARRTSPGRALGLRRIRIGGRPRALVAAARAFG
jgi:hypothetical protein